jgi:peptidoglycan-associated lipoprotein
MSARFPFLAALALSLAACASQPKSLNPSTDVVDGAAATAPEPAPVAAAPEPGCRADADCASGERCDYGRCEAVGCSLVRVSFAFDSAQLDPVAMDALRENARCLAERRAASLLVEGHCDERGTSEYNVALGARRAEAVKRYLSDLGVTASLDAVSFGKEIPLVEGTGEAAWAQNRRAELRLPGDRRSDGTIVAGR